MRYLVTGANRGIGLEFVTQLIQRGEEVIATVRRPEAAAELQALVGRHGDQLSIWSLDVADPDSVAALKDAFQGQSLDVVIHNAGIMPHAGRFGELDYDAIRRGFEVNTIGPLRVAEASLPALLRGERRVFAALTSKMGSIADNGSGGSYAYRMSKTALNMGVRSLALDHRDRGLVAFVLHPGWVLTDMGGPNALITTEQSVQGMLRVIDGADSSASGRFWEWNGKEVPW